MRLRFFYQPVPDVEAAAAFYRDELGFEELWREGPDTISFTLPGSNVGLMLDRSEHEYNGGLFFVVPSVPEFYERNRARLTFVQEPRKIPPGMFASFVDPAGNTIRIMDDSTSSERS